MTEQLRLFKPQFTIRPYSTEPSKIEESRTFLTRDIERMKTNIIRKGSMDNNGLDSRMCQILDNLDSNTFWRSFAVLEGPERTQAQRRNTLFSFSSYPTDHQVRTIQEERRAWTQENFVEYELNNLLNILVNEALLKPSSHCPGHDRGHSILYRELVMKPSVFRDSVTPEFEQRLMNGRFWESLTLSNNYNIQGDELYDTLINHFDELSPQYAQEGLRHTGFHSLKKFSPPLASLGGVAILKYAEFVNTLLEEYGKLDGQGGVSYQTAIDLARPLFSNALVWDHHEELPLFSKVRYDVIKSAHEDLELEEGITYCTELPKVLVTYQDILSTPLMKTYMRRVVSNEDERKHVCRVLSNLITHQGSDDSEYTAQVISDVMEFIPEQKWGDRRKVMKGITEHDGISKNLINVLRSDPGENLTKYL